MRGLGYNVLGGSWDLVTRVISKVTIVIIAYNPPNRVLITLLAKSHDPPSKGCRAAMLVNCEGSISRPPPPQGAPKGPSTHDLRTPVPKTIPLLASGTRVLKYWVLGPAG